MNLENGLLSYADDLRQILKDIEDEETKHIFQGAIQVFSYTAELIKELEAFQSSELYSEYELHERIKMITERYAQ
jgi:hypothetical protein